MTMAQRRRSAKKMRSCLRTKVLKQLLLLITKRGHSAAAAKRSLAIENHMTLPQYSHLPFSSGVVGAPQ